MGDGITHQRLTNRKEPVESRMLGNGHVRFGRRARETDRSKERHRALVRPHVMDRHGNATERREIFVQRHGLYRLPKRTAT